MIGSTERAQNTDSGTPKLVEPPPDQLLSNRGFDIPDAESLHALVCKDPEDVVGIGFTVEVETGIFSNHFDRRPTCVKPTILVILKRLSVVLIESVVLSDRLAREAMGDRGCNQEFSFVQREVISVDVLSNV